MSSRPTLSHTNTKKFLAGSVEPTSMSREWKMEGSRGTVLAYIHSDSETGEWRITQGVHMITTTPMVDGQEQVGNGQYVTVAATTLPSVFAGGADSQIFQKLLSFYYQLPGAQ